MKRIVLLAACFILLTGCGKEEPAKQVNSDAVVTEVPENSSQADSSSEQEKGFEFLYNDVTIPMNVDAAPIIDALGEPQEYFEAASCAFQGLDKTYTYSGFELTTYPKDDLDYVSTIYVLDDSVTTDKGIYIGSTLEEVTSAYGTDYSEESGEYTFTMGASTLSFLIEDDCVTSITYSAVVDGLN